jgi:hypothetical protein
MRRACWVYRECLIVNGQVALFLSADIELILEKFVLNFKELLMNVTSINCKYR